MVWWSGLNIQQYPPNWSTWHIPVGDSNTYSTVSNWLEVVVHQGLQLLHLQDLLNGENYGKQWDATKTLGSPYVEMVCRPHDVGAC